MQAPAAAPPPWPAPLPGPPPSAIPKRGPADSTLSPDAYNGGGQNWALVQDARGVIYVASTNALLEYRRRHLATNRRPRPARPCARWRWMRRAASMWAPSAILATSSRTTNGETRSCRLLDKLPADARVFEDVWRTFATPAAFIFQTQIGLFRWADGTMKVWKPTGRIFNRAQFANDTIYIGQTGGVLMALRSDELVPVPGAERWVRRPIPS